MTFKRYWKEVRKKECDVPYKSEIELAFNYRAIIERVR